MGHKLRELGGASSRNLGPILYPSSVYLDMKVHFYNTTVDMDTPRPVFMLMFLLPMRFAQCSVAACNGMKWNEIEWLDNLIY